jgi:hypothetical protein
VDELKIYDDALMLENVQALYAEAATQLWISGPLSLGERARARGGSKAAFFARARPLTRAARDLSPRER